MSNPIKADYEHFGEIADNWIPHSAVILGLPQYQITDLGTLGPGGTFARAINDAGQVVGISGTRAFLWEWSTGMIDLGLLGDPEDYVDPVSSALAINDRGVVVGVSGDAESPDPFIWDSTSGMHSLRGGTPYGINNAGQVVGTPAHLLDTSTGVYHDWQIFGHGVLFVSAINNAGQATGYAISPSGEAHAFFWDPRTGRRDLGALGGWESMGNAMNDAGQVTGYSYDVNGEPRAFFWDAAIGMIDIGPGWAYGINDTGQVVGSTSAWDPRGQGFYWDSAGGMVVIDSLTGAADINNQGQIVGYSRILAGRERALLLNPIPEPATILLLAGGLTLIRRRPRDRFPTPRP